MKHHLTIYIDSRTGSKDLIHYEPLAPFSELCYLPAGDVCFTGNSEQGDVLCGIELKSLDDLLSSIENGRLSARQIPLMLQTYDVPWLCYYGLYRPGPPPDYPLEVMRSGKLWSEVKKGSRKFTYPALESYLAEITELGIRVKRVTSKKESAIWIAGLAKFWSKNTHRALHRFDESAHVSLPACSDKGIETLAHMTKQIPGIGFKKAFAVAAYFKNPLSMASASLAEWEKVTFTTPKGEPRGIGKQAARRAYKFMSTGLVEE